MPADNEQHILNNQLAMQIAEATEAGAIGAAHLRGRGDEAAADLAAVEAIQAGLNKMSIQGAVVIGEGERDECEMLYVGEELGSGKGPELDIAVDALEGTTICAKSLQGALSVIGVAKRGGFLKVPDIYMDKIAIGPGYERGLVDLDASVADNLNALAKAKGVPVNRITACVLDRSRHGKLIEEIRGVGAAIRLIGDGDIAGVINTTNADETFIDIYLGLGGASEGVLAAAAVRCLGGQMQGRLAPLKEQDHAKAAAVGIENINQKYNEEDLASGDVIFAATGVTNGSVLHGVQFRGEKIVTNTLVMSSASKTSRKIVTTRGSTAS